MTSTTTQQLLRLLRYGAVAFAVFGVLIATSIHGIGYSSDSFSYLQGAASPNAEGISTAEYSLIHFPPLLPLTLALLPETLILPFYGLLLVINVALFAYVLVLAEIRIELQIGAILMVAASPVFLLLHGIIQSEPLFLILMQLTIIFLVKDQPGWAVLCLALAPLQRYAGVALIPAVMLVIVWRYGYRRAVVSGVVMVLPIGLWMLRNTLVADNPGREFGFRMVLGERLMQGAVQLAPWLAPLAVVALVMFITSRYRPSMPQVITLALLFMVVYFGFLLFSVSFFDHFTPFDFRILSQVILLAWVVLVWFIDRQLTHLRQYQQLALLAISLLFVAYAVVGTAYAITRRPDGLGIVRAVKPGHFDVLAAIPDDVTIYANQIYVVRLMGREAISPPANLYDTSDDAQYRAQMAEMIAQVEAGEAVILWFDDFDRPQLVNVEELKRRLPYEDYDGLLLFSVEISFINR